MRKYIGIPHAMTPSRTRDRWLDWEQRYLGNALAMYKLPSLYDFLEYSAFAEDVSISLEALYVGSDREDFSEHDSSAVLIPSNDAWRIFAETSLTKSCFQRRIKSTSWKVWCWDSSLFSTAKKSSGAMKSLAQSYGGDDLPFILVEDIHTSDGLLMIVSHSPRNASREVPGVEILRPVFLLKERSRVAL